MGREFKQFQEAQELVKEAIAAVTDGNELVALVDRLEQEAELNVKTQKEITENVRKENEERRQLL